MFDLEGFPERLLHRRRRLYRGRIRQHLRAARSRSVAASCAAKTCCAASTKTCAMRPARRADEPASTFHFDRLPTRIDKSRRRARGRARPMAQKLDGRPGDDRDRAAAPTRRASGSKRRASSSIASARSRSTLIRKTSVASIYAVGDVTNRLDLTPVAIREGHALRRHFVRRQADRRRACASPDSRLHDAGTRHGRPDRSTRRGAIFAIVDIYLASFRPLKATLSGRAEKMIMKIVVDGETDRVLGVHILGEDAGEMAQLLGIAVKMGAKKADFDATMARASDRRRRIRDHAHAHGPLRARKLDAGLAQRWRKRESRCGRDRLSPCRPARVSPSPPALYGKRSRS